MSDIVGRAVQAILDGQASRQGVVNDETRVYKHVVFHVGNMSGDQSAHYDRLLAKSFAQMMSKMSES